jgi:hypothetical protein
MKEATKNQVNSPPLRSDASLLENPSELEKMKTA